MQITVQNRKFHDKSALLTLDFILKFYDLITKVQLYEDDHFFLQNLTLAYLFIHDDIMVVSTKIDLLYETEGYQPVVKYFLYH